MMKYATIFVAVAAFFSTATEAQEHWARAPVPPAVDSAGIVSGTEYITARCDLSAPGNFRCADDPKAVRQVFIPISSFARSSTVEALQTTVAGLQGQLTGFDARIAALETLTGSESAAISQLSHQLAADRISARKGIAAAVAMGSAPMPSAPGRTSYDFNLATFRGQEAIGATLKHRLNTAEPVAISFGFSAAGHGNNAARFGVSGEF
jgi:hypothetical protein